MFRNLAVAALFVAASLVVQTSFAQSPSPRPSEAQTASEIAPPTGDVAVYWSPTKTISASASERLLNSDEWTGFYLQTVERFDAARFQNRPDSSLKKRLEAVFPDAPASLGGLLDAVFGSCRGVWLDLTLDPKTLRIAAFSGVWVSDFDESTELIVAALADAGYVERLDPSGKGAAPRRFVRVDSAAETSLFLDALAPISEGSPLSAVFLAGSAADATKLKAGFAANPEFARLLDPEEKSIAFVRIGPTGLEKFERFCDERVDAGRESTDATANDENDEGEDVAADDADDSNANASGDLFAVWAPGLAELSRRLEGVSVSFQDAGDEGVVASAEFVAKDVETTKDLQYLTIESKKTVGEWAKTAQTTPAQALGAAILAGATEGLVDETAFAATYRFAEPAIFDLLKRYFQSRTAGAAVDVER